MDETASSKPILWRIDDRGVAYLTLNRPEVYNAYNDEMIAGLLAAFDKLAHEPIGVRQVRRYALTAERFDVKEAHRIGLVHEIVPLAELQAAGERIVDHLLANGPEAIAQTKACALRLAWSNLEDDAFPRLIGSSRG